MIAFSKGAHGEVVREGVTGFLVEDPAQAVLALQNISSISSQRCVRYAQENFSAVNMAENYSGVYARVAIPEKTLRHA